MRAVDRRSLVRSAIRAGAVLAATKTVILGVLHLAFGVPALVSVATGVLLWAATISVLLLAAFRLPRETGGLQPYTRVLFHLCLIWALGQLIYTGFSILLFHVIEPSLLETTVEPMREIARRSGERQGMPAAEIETWVASITREASPFSVWGQLRGYRDGLLPGIVIAALMAIPFRGTKRDAPTEGATPHES